MSKSSIINERLSELIGKADSIAVYETMPQLKEHWESKSWVSCKSKYKDNPNSQIVIDVQWKEKINHRDLGEFVAASAFLHCFNGWSYLSRAYEAELAGDPEAARHLGYYAELRATLSILAREGIGFVNNHYAVVTKLNECEVGANPCRGGSHKFIWKALASIMETTDRNHLFINSITPGGMKLSKWLDPAKDRYEAIEYRWLYSWGLDMREMSNKDRKARNNASYNPTMSLNPRPTPILKTIESIRDLWRMCKPCASRAFEELDKHLLRNAMTLIINYKNDPTLTSREDWEKAYSLLIIEVLSGMAPIDDEKSWESFLMYNNPDDFSRLIADANGSDVETSVNHSGQVLARATMLLRIASGGVDELLENACDRKQLRKNLSFWTNTDSVTRKIYRAPQEPGHQTFGQQRDLDKELNTLDKMLEQFNNHKCERTLFDEFISTTRLLTKTERIFLMSVGL